MGAGIVIGAIGRCPHWWLLNPRLIRAKQYLAPFDILVGDRRTWTTLTETVRGIIGSGSLICQRIATQSPILSSVQKGAQRVIRMVTGQTTKRSPRLDAAHLTAQLRAQALRQLRT